MLFPVVSLEEKAMRRDRRMLIGDVASSLGISSEWLRQLERTGRIPPARRDINGYRRYDEQDLERLRAILFPPARTETR